MGFTNKDEHHHFFDYESDMFTGITTFHGLVRIYNSKQWWGRVFWVVVVLAAFVVFILQAYSLLSSYHMKPTGQQGNFVVPEDGMDFPDITICNFNPVKMSVVRQNYNTMTNNTLKYILLSYLQVENLYSAYRKEDIVAWDKEYTNYTDDYAITHNGKNFSLLDFFINTGYTCEDMFKECTFGGITLKNCCEWAHPIMTDIGLCYKFSEFGANKWMKKQLISGAYYGLHMLIDIMEDEYTAGLADMTSSMDAGIKFYVHPSGVLPFLSSMGSAIPPGTRGYGAISVRNFTLLPKDEWGKCQYEWDSINNETVWVEDGTYSSSNCEANCIANTFQKNCSCVPLRYQLNNKNLTVCTPKNLYECVNVTQMTETETYWYSSCTCGVECDRIEYNVEMSYSRIPNKAAELPLANRFNQTADYVKTNFLILNTYMKEISYEKYDQQKTLDRTAVLSDIGGNMGMFLGMSVITLGEIFVFIIKTIWGWMPYRRHHLRTRDVPELDTPLPKPDREEEATTKNGHGGIRKDPYEAGYTYSNRGYDNSSHF